MKEFKNKQVITKSEAYIDTTITTQISNSFPRNPDQSCFVRLYFKTTTSFITYNEPSKPADTKVTQL